MMKAAQVHQGFENSDMPGNDEKNTLSQESISYLERL